jgi:hypothetical protein
MSWAERLQVSAQSRQSWMQATMAFTSDPLRQAVAQLSQAVTHS